MEHYTEISPTLWVSQMAETLIGSEILKIATDIKALQAKGKKIHNYTIGDFNPAIFPIPQELKKMIIQAYEDGFTNYPSSNGEQELRKSVSRFLHTRLGLEYNENQILIAGGSRPIIYSIFQTIVDPGDTVVFPVPSWNNNHYTHLSRGKAIYLETTPENNFMPSYYDIKPHVQNASLICLCSPLNPTGTMFTKTQLEKICELVLEENKRRNDPQKPLYLLYDQVYWTLVFNNAIHYDPVSLFPEMKNYTIFVDGISKSLAATGVRVGWAMGPQKIIDKMKNILGHIGAWAPKPEQIATAKYLNQDEEMDAFMYGFKEKILARLNAFYDGFKELKAAGYPVDAVLPQASIYLSVKIDIIEKAKGDDVKSFQSSKDVTDYLLQEGGIALVPFTAFGSSNNSPWFRISIGESKIEEIPTFFETLKKILDKIMLLKSNSITNE